MKFKEWIALLKNKPKEILILISFAVVVGLLKLIEGSISLVNIAIVTVNLATQQTDTFNLSLVALLHILIGILYLYIAKWITIGEERGRSSLFFVTLIDLLFTMWQVSNVIAAFTANGFSALSYIHIIPIALFAVFGYIVYLTTKDSIKAYFR